MQPAKSTIKVSGREVRVYNDDHFYKLRERHGLRDDFLEAGWDMKTELRKSDAKGGALMADIGGDFVVKSLDAGDHASLLDIAAGYVEHMMAGESLLAPIYLHWQDVEENTNYFVMGSACGKGPFLSLYDLKGCADDKKLEQGGKPVPAVHKRFFNLCMWCGPCPNYPQAPCAWSDARVLYFKGKVEARGVRITVTAEQRDQIVEKIRRDTSWLEKNDLMDYSLLVAVKEGPPGSFTQPRLPFQQLLMRRHGTHDVATSVGIIDYLQKWNFSKVIANMIKVLESNKATIKPEPYAKRFNKHFKSAFVSDNTVASNEL